MKVKTIRNKIFLGMVEVEKICGYDVDFNRDFKNNSELFSDIFWRNNND